MNLPRPCALALALLFPAAARAEWWNPFQPEAPTQGWEASVRPAPLGPFGLGAPAAPAAIPVGPRPDPRTSRLDQDDVQVSRDASRPAPGVAVLYPGDHAGLRIRLGLVAAATAQVVDLYRPDGRVSRVPVSREGGPDSTWLEARFDPADLVPAGPVAYVLESTDAGDAPAFRDDLPAARPDLTVAYHRVRLDERAPGAHVGARDVFEAGGIHEVPFRLLDDRGGPLATGAVALAAQARWIYASGHYPAGDGLDFGGQEAHPSQVTGAGWPAHLKVLIWSACYAAEVGGQPLDERRLSGRGLDGAAWWDRFHGTVLGYRESAPTQGAPAVIQDFLGRLREAGVGPGDTPRDSRAVARAWMWANGRRRATYATAIDEAGTYYFMGKPEVPLAGAREVGTVALADGKGSVAVYAVPQEAWRPAVALLEYATRQEKPLLKVLERGILAHTGGRPFDTIDEFLAAGGVGDLLRAEGYDPADPRVVQVLAGRLRYLQHLYYESDAGSTMVQLRMTHLARRHGPGVLTVERLRAERRPSAAAHANSRAGRLQAHTLDPDHEAFLLRRARVTAAGAS